MWGVTMKKTIIISIDDVDNEVDGHYAPDIMGYFEACGRKSMITKSGAIAIIHVSAKNIGAEPEQEQEPEQSYEITTDIEMPNVPDSQADIELPSHVNASSPAMTTDDECVLDVPVEPFTDIPKFFCYRLNTFFDVEIDDEFIEPVMYVNDIRILSDDAVAIRLNGFETIFSKSAGVLHELDKSAVSARVSVFLSTSSTDTAEVLIKVFIADGINTYPATVKMSQTSFVNQLKPIIDYGANDAETY